MQHFPSRLVLIAQLFDRFVFSKMSAIFMSRHRFSTINPEDIARFGSRSLSLNSISFKPLSENDEDYDEDEDEHETILEEDEEKRIGTPSEPRRRRSTKTRPDDPRAAALAKLKRRWDYLSERYGLKHVIPILLLILYSVLGALVFSAVELPHAQEKRAHKLLHLQSNRQWAADSIITSLALTNNTRDYDTILEILRLADANNSLPPPEVLTWNIWGGLFFVGQVYTTIGKGI